MENEKCTRDTIYGICAAILVSFAIIIFIFASANVASLSKHWLYILIKDHGSLIGGVLAIIGVFIMVSNQNKTTRESLDQQSEVTRKLIKSSMDVMRYESLEIKKEKAREFIFIVESALYKYFNSHSIAASAPSVYGLATHRKEYGFLSSTRIQLSYIDHIFNNKNDVANKCLGVINAYINLSGCICADPISYRQLSIASKSLYVEIHSLKVYGDEAYLDVINCCDSENSSSILLYDKQYMALSDLSGLDEVPHFDKIKWQETNTMDLRNIQRKSSALMYCQKVILNVAIPLLLSELEKIDLYIEN